MGLLQRGVQLGDLRLAQAVEAAGEPPFRALLDALDQIQPDGIMVHDVRVRSARPPATPPPPSEGSMRSQTALVATARLFAKRLASQGPMATGREAQAKRLYGTVFLGFPFRTAQPVLTRGRKIESTQAVRNVGDGGVNVMMAW